MKLDEERAYVEHLRGTWLHERDRLRKVVAECAATHTTPPPNYWEKAYRAEKRFMMALNVLTVLEGV